MSTKLKLAIGTISACQEPGGWAHYMNYQCNMTRIVNGDITMTSSLHVLVWEEDGEELLISWQEMIVRVSGERPHNLVLASVEWPVMIVRYVLLQISLLMPEGVWES